MIRDYHAAEDITQDVFIDGYIKLNSLSDYNKLGAWLAKIAKNKCCNYLSREAMKYKQERELDELIPDTRNFTPENYIIQKQEQENLAKAVDKLPDSQKTVIVLFYYENHSQKKIAEVLRIPEGTVKRRLYDARLNLKKELDRMSENKINNINNINNINFEEEVAKKIKSLHDYYRLHNFSKDSMQKEVDEFIEFIDSMPESKLKHKAYVTAYEYSTKEEYTSRLEKEIELAGDSQAYVSFFWNNYANKSSDEEWLKAIDSEKGLQKVEKMEKNDNAAGEMYFWRGVCNTRLNHLKEAKTDFETAEQKLNRDNSYHANAIAGIKAVNMLSAEPDKYLTSPLGVCGESYILHYGGKKAEFRDQPGFSSSSNNKNRFDSVYFFSAGMKNSRKFFDLDLKENETGTDGEDTLISRNETITVLAGTFENCVHMRSTSPSSTHWKTVVTDAWYAKDIGLIKSHITDEGKDDENYELWEYKINGGEGYMPAYEGNIWKYKNLNLSDCYEQIIEYETVSVIDYPEIDRKVMYVAALTALRIPYDANDSEICITFANGKGDEYKFDDSIKALKNAVRANTSEKPALFALHAIDYMTRMKDYIEIKKYRLMPSGIAGSLVKKTDGKILYTENGSGYHVGPHRLGTRHEESKIFGMKPFRYLNRFVGTLFDEKWVAGYSETKKIDDGDLYITVEDGGTVKVKAGTFENCLKVIFNLELEPDNGKRDYFRDFKYTHCGTKIFYYAPDVGIVKHDCEWGDSKTSEWPQVSVCELSEYNSVATTGEYMPVYIGSKWIYDEMTLEPGYLARRKYDIVSGMQDEFFMIDEQEYVYRGTEEEYEEFKKTLKK